MAVITKTEALRVIRHAYGPDYADSLAGRLPTGSTSTTLRTPNGCSSWD
jgi:hypothetical protein